MVRWLDRHRLLFDAVAALLLATLLLRGLTPPGFMPGAGPVGLRLCTSAGLVDAASPAPTHDGSAEDPDHAKGVCFFAAASGTIPASVFGDFVGVPDDVRRVSTDVVQAPGARGAALAPWPRGPPHSPLIHSAHA
jgi:hypothetical protein